MFRYAPPRFVVVLENSAMMGSQWDLVRVMTRNLILEQEYLPDSASLGIVMFSAAAYTEHPVVALSSANRQSLSLSIRSKHNLSPSTDNCVICGVRKAVEALHGESGVIILISRGGQSVRSAGEEPGHSADIWSLADKHRLRCIEYILQYIYSIVLYISGYSQSSFRSLVRFSVFKHQTFQSTTMLNSSSSTPPQHFLQCTDNVSMQLTPFSGEVLQTIKLW